MIKNVYVLFKTHLDIGFTDFAKNVVDGYITDYIPKAIKTGYELKEKGLPFIWTTGSWLIWEALKSDDGKVAKAIEDGIIAWHGLPFTSHTELMSTKLFEYGLSLSKKLDERFGKTTTAAKMTDVPGHTCAMLPSLNKYGIRFLHIGINEASPMPEVPWIFKWRYRDSEVYVMYEIGYGATREIGETAIVFGHTHDNMGPQSAEELEKFYEGIRTKYPNANIKAATLNDIVPVLDAQMDLPVVEKEIGDSWIHGAGTDPKKVGMYRELLRYIEKADISDIDLTDNLLLVPEHTWGMNTNKFFRHYCDFGLEEFKKYENHPDRLMVEKSWQEQRDYVTEAAKRLGVELTYDVTEPELSKYEKTSVSEPAFTLSWQIFDNDDAIRFMKNYCQFTPQNIGWACFDNLKVGMPEYKGGIYEARVTECYRSEESLLCKLEFDEKVKAEYGLPYFWAEMSGNTLTLKWFGKAPLRLPNACWLKFNGYGEGFKLRKLGYWIAPEDITGSPLICATDFGIGNSAVTIESKDACLVAPFGRRLYDYEVKPIGEDMYFNLYNNIWGTNFPMWYSDDTKFEFVIDEK